MPPPVFRARATTIFRVSLALALTSPVAFLFIAWLWARSPLSQDNIQPQPIEFDHRHHVGDDGIDCRYCHTSVERSSTAGFPSTSVCMNCHAQIWNRAGLTRPIRASYFTDRPIEWARIYRLPDYVFFNHAIHVNKGIGCVSCHGRVDQMPTIRRQEELTMAWCLDCHRNPEPQLRPLNEITNLQWRPPKGEAGRQLGAQLRAAYDVNPPTDCYACHR